MAEIRETLGKNVRKLRAAKGLSQEKLADQAGISDRYIGAIERGEYAATITVVENLARALGVTASDLLKE